MRMIITMSYQPLNDDKLCQEHIELILGEVYSRIEELLEWLPSEQDDAIKGKDLTEEQRQSLLNVDAIEQEWIIDPELRDDLSVVRTR